MSGYSSKAEAWGVLSQSIEKRSHGDQSLPNTTKAYYIGALFDECFIGGNYNGWGITDAGLTLSKTMRKHLRPHWKESR